MFHRNLVLPSHYQISGPQQNKSHGSLNIVSSVISVLAAQIYILLWPSCGTLTTTLPQVSLAASAFNAAGTFSRPTYS